MPPRRETASQRLPADAQASLNRAKNSTELATTMRAELEASPLNREQVHSTGDLGELPLTVISATAHGMTAELEAYTMDL